VFRVSSIHYEYPQGEKIRIKGQVLTDPVAYDNSRYIKINGLRAYVDLYPEVLYGDYVVLEGEVDGDRLKDSSLVSVERGGGIYGVRESIIRNFQKALPEPHAALVSGIVLGSKANMPQDFWEKLKLTGTAHVVVASGMNVTFVTSFLLNSLVHFMNRRKAVIIALSGAWVYVVLSGFDAPLVRAAVMGSIAFGAQGLGRVSIALRALFYSAAAMILIKPDWIYDLGFILSFVATLSLIVFEPKVSRLLSKVPFVLKKDLSTTIAAQIGVAPILYISFGNFNLFSPIINSLILFTIPPIMVIGAVSAIAGLLVPFFGRLIVMLSLPFTYWFVGVVDLFA
jgi:competence protein ComEC